MNDNREIPNPALREAATQVAFQLTLSRNQIAILDAIAHGRREVTETPGMRASRLWVPHCHQLHAKGMLLHKHAPNFIGEQYGKIDDNINNYYRLTKAGWLMHDLLAEAGMVYAVTERKLRKLVA